MFRFSLRFNFTDGATDHIWDDLDLHGNGISDVTLIDTILVLSSFFTKVDVSLEFSCKTESKVYGIKLKKFCILTSLSLSEVNGSFETRGELTS